jgi:glycerophosphoryl diester phosphodiesterase
MMARLAPAWLTAWEYAHRGLHGPGIPENSLAAAEGAIARGLGIECDIQMSADGVPMVFHDWELSRLTGEAGLVASRSADELEALRLLGTSQHPVRLARFLDGVAGQVPVLVEIKSLPLFDIAAACRAVSEVLTDYAGDFAVMSFDPRMGAWFAKHQPAILRGLVATDTFDGGFQSKWREPTALDLAIPDFLAIDVRDLPNAISDLWRAANRPLLTWTIRSPETRAVGLAHADALIAEGEGLA